MTIEIGGVIGLAALMIGLFVLAAPGHRGRRI